MLGEGALQRVPQGVGSDRCRALDQQDVNQVLGSRAGSFRLAVGTRVCVHLLSQMLRDGNRWKHDGLDAGERQHAWGLDRVGRPGGRTGESDVTRNCSKVRPASCAVTWKHTAENSSASSSSPVLTAAKLKKSSNASCCAQIPIGYPEVLCNIRHKAPAKCISRFGLALNACKLCIRCTTYSTSRMSRTSELWSPPSPHCRFR
jgi:hypothetical protein